MGNKKLLSKLSGDIAREVCYHENCMTFQELCMSFIDDSLQGSDKVAL